MLRFAFCGPTFSSSDDISQRWPMSSMTLTLRRGMAVPPNEAVNVVANIRAGGMTGFEGEWRFYFPEITAVRSRLGFLFGKADLTTDEALIPKPFLAVCRAAQPPARRTTLWFTT